MASRVSAVSIVRGKSSYITLKAKGIAIQIIDPIAGTSLFVTISISVECVLQYGNVRDVKGIEVNALLSDMNVSTSLNYKRRTPFFRDERPLSQK